MECRNDSSNELAAWPVSPTGDTLPQLCVRSMFSHEDISESMHQRSHTPRSSVQKASSRHFPAAQDDLESSLLVNDKNLLNMYRDMARVEEADAEPFFGSPRSGRQKQVSVVNLEADAALHELANDPANRRASMLPTAMNPLPPSTPAPRIAEEETQKEQGPMTIHSYVPKSTPAKPPHSVKVYLEHFNLEEMKAWRDKKSWSRPPSAGTSRPPSAGTNRPMSAKGTPKRPALGFHEVRPQVESTDEASGVSMFVQGLQIDPGRALQHLHDAEIQSIAEDVAQSTVLELEADEMLCNNAADHVERSVTRQIGSRGIVPHKDPDAKESEHWIESALTISDTFSAKFADSAAKHAGNDGGSVASRESRPPSTSRSSSWSRPASAGRARNNLLSLPPPVGFNAVPALISAEQKMGHDEWLHHQQENNQARQQEHTTDAVYVTGAERAPDPSAHATKASTPNTLAAKANTRAPHTATSTGDEFKAVEMNKNEQERFERASSVHTAFLAARAAGNTETHTIPTSTSKQTTEDHAALAETEDDGSSGGLGGFMMCPSCSRSVPIRPTQPSKQIILKYFSENTSPTSNSCRPHSPNAAATHAHVGRLCEVKHMWI